MQQSKDQTNGVKRYGWLVLLCLLIGAGCGDNKPASLKEDEVIRHRAKQKRLPATSLSVSGETLTLEKVMDLTVPNDYGLPGPPLGGILVSMAEELPSYEDFEKQALLYIKRTVDTEVSSILLYQKLKREAGDKLDEGLESMAERDWRDYVLQNANGNDAEAEELLRSQNSSREKYKESRKRWALTQYYISNKISIDQPIGHKEILAYFERQKDTVFAEEVKITFRLIELQAAKMTGPEDPIDRMAAAIKLAEEVKEKLDQGANFAELAQQYSHGHMAHLGGLWVKRNPASLAEPYDRLGYIANSLQPGQVSDPVILPDRIFIMKLEERESHGTKPLAEVQPTIEGQIEKDRKTEIRTTLNEDLAQQAKVGDIDGFIKACLQQIYATYHPVGDDFIGPLPAGR